MWRINALKYCVSFYCITMWISYNYTHIPSPGASLSPTSHLSMSSTEKNWPTCVIEQLPLAVSHMIVYIFHCFFPCSSHPLLPPLRPRVCCLCVSLYSWPADMFFSTIFLGFIYMHYICYYFFSFCLTSFCITGSRFIHLILADSNSLFYGSFNSTFRTKF